MGKLLSLLLASCVLTAQEAPADRLMHEIASRNELMANLEALCDGIGPRLSRSRNVSPFSNSEIMYDTRSCVAIW